MSLGERRAHHQLTFAVLAIGVSAFALLQSLVIPVLPTIQRELHTTQSAVAWVLTAYLLSASIMTPISGRIGDMLGKEHVFVTTLIALAVGSALAAVAPSIGVLIVARVIQGARRWHGSRRVRDHARRVPARAGLRCGGRTCCVDRCRSRDAESSWRDP